MTNSTLDVNIPSLASKKIKITQYENGRKVQISSNLLVLMGFEKGAAVIEKSLGKGKGYSVELAEPLANGEFPTRVKRIYSRTYKSRRNNPLELSFETSAKSILDEAIPQNVKYVHITMMRGRLVVKPLMEHIADRLSSVIKAANPFTVFSACTAGVDVHAAHSAGFEINSVLEWRPQEKRDNRDITETGLMSVLGNVPVKHVFSEDITEVSTEYLHWATKNSPSTCFTVSLQCDDFSNVKSNKNKELSHMDTTSSLDMVYDGLRIIGKMLFPVVILEQVAPFAKSDLMKMWDLRLRKWGYKTQELIADARDFGGLSSRKRLFHVATLLPSEFNFPESTPRRDTPVWDEFIAPRIDDFRDISHTSSMAKGLETGRLRTVDKESVCFPTVLKSQARQAKDSLVMLTDDGKVLFPDEALLKTIMGIPEGFKTNLTNGEQASEIIGQSVDYPFYKELMTNVKAHIQAFIDSSAVRVAA